MTRIALIAAMARNGVIGRDNQLPWRQSADLQRFKRLTLGKAVVMGRKTWQSLGRPLPDRLNIVITRDSDYRTEGGMVTHSVRAALAAAGDSEEIMVIGGAEIFRQTLALAERLYLTEIEADIEGDTHFPEIDATDWVEVERQAGRADARNEYDYQFVVLERRRGDAGDVSGQPQPGLTTSGQA